MQHNSVMLLAVLIVVEIVDVDDGRLVATKSYSSVKSNAAMVATAVVALLFFVSVGDLRGEDIGVGDMNVSTEVISSKSKKFQLLVDTSLISS